MRKTIVVERNGENEWHLWFAWHPVTVDHKIKEFNGDALKLRTTVWWEPVERRYSKMWNETYEYRFSISMGN
jgi:hypothetical protein